MISGKVTNVKKLNVDMLFGQGALRSKHKLSLNVDTFGQGALRLKHKLSLNVKTLLLGTFFKQMKV